LRARVRALEGVRFGAPEAVVPLGAEAIDRALPWGGLPRAGLHEIVAGTGERGDRERGDGARGAPIENEGAGERGGGDAIGAATGFAAALAGRLAGARGPVLWCLGRGDLHGPGLGAFGLTPARLIVARARAASDVLWAMEAGLRAGRLGAVLGEVAGLDAVAGRRLALAARERATPCLLLRPAEAAAGVAVTRWRVAAAPSARADGLAGLGRPRWRLALVRCRGGVPRSWLVEWDDAAPGFLVVSPLGVGAAGERAA